MNSCEVEEETAGQEEKLVVGEERTETVVQPPDSTYTVRCCFIDESLCASVMVLFRLFSVFTRCHLFAKTVLA